jgi:hypothetical protein
MWPRVFGHSPWGEVTQGNPAAARAVKVAEHPYPRQVFYHCRTVQQRDDAEEDEHCKFKPAAHFPTPKISAHDAVLARRSHRHRSLPQSSSASRFTAGAAGFFILS